MFCRYVATAYCGVSAFGSSTQGNVLLNLDPIAVPTIAAKERPPPPAFAARHSTLTRVMQVLMGLHILLALPVMIVPFRRSIAALETSLVSMWKLRRVPVQQGESSNSLQSLSTQLLGDSDQQCAAPSSISILLLPFSRFVSSRAVHVRVEHRW